MDIKVNPGNVETVAKNVDAIGDEIGQVKKKLNGVADILGQFWVSDYSGDLALCIKKIATEVGKSEAQVEKIASRFTDAARQAREDDRKNKERIKNDSVGGGSGGGGGGSWGNNSRSSSGGGNGAFGGGTGGGTR